MEYIYLLQDGAHTIGWVDEDQFQEITKDPNFEYYEGNKKYPMIFDTDRDLYISISKVEKSKRIINQK